MWQLHLSLVEELNEMVATCREIRRQSKASANSADSTNAT